MRIKTSSKLEPVQGSNPTVEDCAAEKSSQMVSFSFKKILVPIDFSDCSMLALDAALVLAEKFGSKITLLHVVEPAAYPENYLLSPSTLDETNQNLLTAGRERL